MKMITFPILQVDAFTDTPLYGNPAAVVFDAQGLSDDQMQAIAREMNLSETAFVLPSDVADFRLRFFTPRKEIPLAGHPTIATVHALVEEGRIRLSGEQTTITLELNVGVLPAEIRTLSHKRRLIVMTQKRPEFLTLYPPEQIAAALRIAPVDILEPAQTVSTGTSQLMVRVRNPDILARIEPDWNNLAKFTEQSDFFSVHVFAFDESSPQPRAFARHFAPAAGVNEDPVTGSASGAMGAYLVHYGLISGTTLVAEQGHAMGRPGQAYVEVVTAEGRIESVRVAGEAVTVLRGELLLGTREGR
jgi:trans-2,3-dihydro-3-hydroxyanthranilate isomerase